MKVFLGSNFGHGSAVAAISSEGEILFAVEEGILIGEKNSSIFPSKALSLVTQSLETEDVIWAEGWNQLQRLFYKGFIRTIKYGFRDRAYIQDSLIKEWKRYLEGRKKFKYWKKQLGSPKQVGHHLAHAYSLLPAGLQQHSLILVSDTTAELNSTATYYFNGNEMIPISSSPFPHSIGAVFHQLAYHLGFRGRTGPGKLMALSAYGKPRFLKQLKQIGAVKQGVFRIDLKKYPAWMRNGSWLKFAELSESTELRVAVLESNGRPNLGIDLAASVQAWFTEITWEYIKQSLDIARKKMGLKVDNFGLTGGAALNCQANGVFFNRMPSANVNSLTVSPWSGDAGTAIGAAVWAQVQQGKIGKIRSCLPFYGPALSLDDAKPSDDDIFISVQHIIEREPVALASGRLEFGPRALGGRCLLSDPRQNESRKRLNSMKSRPDFMPTAPVVLEEDYDCYFEGKGSQYMAWTVPAKEKAKKEIPAAVHISGCSRVQVLKKGNAPLLEKVLREFKRQTGCGVLLLTSLNGAGEPIPTNIETTKVVAQRLGAVGLISDLGWSDFSSNQKITDKHVVQANDTNQRTHN